MPEILNRFHFLGLGLIFVALAAATPNIVVDFLNLQQWGAYTIRAIQTGLVILALGFFTKLIPGGGSSGR